MKRLVLVVLVVLVVGGMAWTLWPATVWPQAFCAPVVRVVGVDARALVTYQAHNENLPITPAEHKIVATLREDIVLAEEAAPTAQLQTELRNYAEQLHGIYASMNVVYDAMNKFDERARTQLRACGITPIGR